MDAAHCDELLLDTHTIATLDLLGTAHSLINSRIIFITYLYIALHKTPNALDCYRGGAVPNASEPP